MAQKVVWIGGLHSVGESLASKPEAFKELWIAHRTQDPAIAGMIRRARAAGINVQFIRADKLERMTGLKHAQGVAAKITMTPAEDFGAFLRSLAKDAILVALDQIQDPHNLGAIARSAVNLGARALLVPERRSCPVTPAAVAASAGAIQKIPVFHVVNLAQALASAKEAGCWIYGADMAGKACWEVRLNLPLVLVIGSEGQGMRPLVKSRCDELIRIPQSEAGVGSLNASCAASVLLYEIARQNRGRP